MLNSRTVFLRSVAGRITIVLTLLFTFASLSTAAEIGRVTVNGRVVILNDDNTWAYGSEAPEVSSKCTEVTSEVLPVSVCLDPDEWTFANLGGEAEHKLRHKEHELYLLIITEKVDISIANLKKAAISNAQSASGLTKVQTLLDGSTLIANKNFGQIDYRTTVDGIDITYINYNTNFKDKGAMQMVFFAASEQIEDMRDAINEVLAGVRISE